MNAAVLDIEALHRSTVAASVSLLLPIYAIESIKDTEAATVDPWSASFSSTAAFVKTPVMHKNRRSAFAQMGARIFYALRPMPSLFWMDFRDVGLKEDLVAASDWEGQAVQSWLCALFTDKTYPVLSPMTQGPHDGATLAIPSRPADFLAAASTAGLTVGRTSVPALVWHRLSC